MPKATQAKRYLRIESNLGPDALILTRAAGRERLGLMFEISLEFTADSGDVDLDALLGTAATVEVGSAPETRKGGAEFTRHFNGYFSRIGFAGFGREGQARFHATLVPWLWFLTRRADCRIFQEKTVPEIIEEVFRDAGFSDFKKDLRGSYPRREYCVQYRETDFNFVSRLMECEGIYYFFEHEKGGHKMVLCDDMVCHKKGDQHGTINFIGGAAARDTKGVITDWNFAKQVKPAKFAHNDFNFTTPVPDPNLRLLARSSAPKPQKPAPFEIYDNAGGYQTIGDGNRYARVRMEEIITDRETSQARTDLIGLKSGCKFRLQKHPIADQNREYLITAVNWSAAEGGYGSGSGGGDFFDCDFHCIPADSNFRPARSTPLPKIEGPQTATVCGPPGEEIYVDKHSRVKVQFHWDRYGKADAGSSCWIRVSQPWAGKGYGGVIVPRIGQEVIVDFIEGDPDRPIICGRVYNGSQMPTGSKGGQPELDRIREKRVLAVAQTKAAIVPLKRAIGGISSGAPASGAVSILAAAAAAAAAAAVAGVITRLGKAFSKAATNPPQGVPDAAMMTTIRTCSLKNTGGSNEITLNDAPGCETLFIKAEKDLTVAVGNDYATAVANDMTLDVGADRHVMVHGDDTLNVAKNINITVQKRFHLVVNDSSITKIDATEQRSIGSNLELTVARDAITTVKRNSTTRITGNEVTEVAKNADLRIGKNYTIELTGGKRVTTIKAGSDSLEVADKIDVKSGKTVTIQAADKIVLKTGAASITLKKDGTIVIEGKNILVKGAAKVKTKAPAINSEASATNTLKGGMVRINS